MDRNTKIATLLENSGYQRGTSGWKEAFTKIEQAMLESEKGIKNILGAKDKSNFEADAKAGEAAGKKNTVGEGKGQKDLANKTDLKAAPEKTATPAGKTEFDKAAKAAEAEGKKNTVGAGTSQKVLANETDLKAAPEKTATPATKASVDAAAKVAEAEGKKNTVGEGTSQKDLSKKGVMESEAASKASVDAAAEAALKNGQKNTVDAGESQEDLANKTDLKEEPSAEAKPASKAKVDAAAAAAEAAGKENTVGKGEGQPNVAKTAKKLMEECAKHQEFVSHVRSFNDGTPERMAYLESVVEKFTQTHHTAELLALTSAYMEAAGEAKAATKSKVDAAAQAALEKGKKNTVGKGKTASVAKTAKKLLAECEKHQEFISFVRSHNDGTAETSAYLENIVEAFVAEHKTEALFEATAAFMEAVTPAEAKVIDTEIAANNAKIEAMKAAIDSLMEENSALANKKS